MSIHHMLVSVLKGKLKYLEYQSHILNREQCGFAKELSVNCSGRQNVNSDPVVKELISFFPESGECIVLADTKQGWFGAI